MYEAEGEQVKEIERNYIRIPYVAGSMSLNPTSAYPACVRVYTHITSLNPTSVHYNPLCAHIHAHA